MVAVTATTIVASSWLAQSAADRRERILLRYAEDLTSAFQVEAAAERMVASGRGYLLTGDGEMFARVRESQRSLDKALSTLDRADASPAKRQLVEAVERDAADYRRVFTQLLETTPATKDRASLAHALRERLIPAREALDRDIEVLLAHEKRVQDAARERAAAMARRTTWLTAALGGGSLVLSALLAAFFTRRLGEIHATAQVNARKAVLALSAKEELLRIVAHDLRSPLSAILLRASSIARTTGDPAVRRATSSIEATGERMANLIESLLEAAQLETGALALSLAPCSVEAVLSASMETFAPAAAQKAIRLERQTIPIDLELRVDRERLLQVLSNLVGNALKFTPSGGVVQLRATSVAGGVRFEVRDSGPGIASENRARVFERYWRSASHSEQGVGLGLYIVKGIVEAHRGRIWVESELGMGSSFIFEIPC